MTKWSEYFMISRSSKKDSNYFLITFLTLDTTPWPTNPSGVPVHIIWPFVLRKKDLARYH